MSTADVLVRTVAQQLPPAAALLVAFSGGRDSTVLLHALSTLRQERRYVVRGVHVNHGLQTAAADWASHCRIVALQLEVPLLSLTVEVRDERDHGLEAAARTARYAAFRQNLQSGEWLLTAHHADDQLETVLLHLFRGSGVAGLAGIPATAAFGAGFLLRPLLKVSSGAVQDYAEQVLRRARIPWLSDPMNADPAFDRSFLRQRVTPVLRERFPAVATAAGRTAELAAEAADLLEDLAMTDHAVTQDPQSAHRLTIDGMRSLKPARQRNLVRYLARQRHWAVPPERRLRTGLSQLLAASTDKRPVLRWAGHEIRRFRQHLYLLDTAVGDEPPPTAPLDWSGATTLHLGGCRGTLSLRPYTSAMAGAGRIGLDSGLLASGLAISFRQGGERLRPAGDAHHRSLKYLFQSAGIVPWMRSQVPLVLIGGKLAAVADLWIASWAAASSAESALDIVWTRHCPLQ